jgi:hypothetical protein
VLNLLSQNIEYMAKQMTDIGLDDSEELTIISGDFIVAESTAQHQQQLLLNTKGDFKENPTVCVGALGYMDDEHFQGLIRAVNIEFTRDGMEVAEVTISPEGVIKSDAVYS